jgi:hypothetical protein
MANIALVKEQLITFTFALSLIMEPVEALERTCYQSRSAHVNTKEDVTKHNLLQTTHLSKDNVNKDVTC